MENQTKTPFYILRPRKFWERLGYGRSTGYSRQNRNLLPPFLELGPKMRGAPDYEADAINAAVISGASEEEIMQLVACLVEARKQAMKLGSVEKIMELVGSLVENRKRARQIAA